MTTAQQPSAFIINSGAASNMGGSLGGAAHTAGNWTQARPVTESPSTESVAYSLMLSIACCEGVCVNTATGTIISGATRQWILNTYAECLQAVSGSGASYGHVANFRQAG